MQRQRSRGFSLSRLISPTSWMEVNKRDPPWRSHASLPAEAGGTARPRWEQGRKLHNTFAWFEKSINLLLCELQRERTTQIHSHRFISGLRLCSLLRRGRWCKLSPMGKVKGQESQDAFTVKPIGAIQSVSLPYGTANMKYAC